MEKQVGHPSLAELKAFNLGSLPLKKAEAIEVHVLDCESCCDTLNQLGEEDTLISLLKNVDQAEEEVTVDLGQTKFTGNPTADTPIPAELVNHSRYCVFGLVGQGGMGVVYEAEHRIMQRKVALKVINPDLVQKPAAVERFRREVHAAARLNHPNIVTAHDAEQAGSVHFLAMEFVDGEELSAIVSREGPLAIQRACDFAQQTALGLQHAYDHGMVHRDIKPQNLMVTSDGVVKILDFGLASFVQDAAHEERSELDSEDDLDAEQSPRLTTLGTVMGTPDYLPPEQICEATEATIRSDIYSLGCTLYYLLAGQAPFAGRSITQKLEAHARQSATPLAEVRDDVPAELSEIVDRMMAKDPEDRFATPAEVAQALSPLAEPTAAAPPRWRKPLVAALAGFGALAAALAVMTIQTPMGTVEVRADAEIAEDIEVELKQGGRTVEVLSPGAFSIELREGVYEVELESDDARVIVDQQHVAVRRNKTTLVEVKLREPPPALKRTGAPLIAVLEGHKGRVCDLAYAPRSKLLASASYDGTARLWDCETGECLATLAGHDGALRSVDFSSDETTVASSGDDGKVLLWQVAQRRPPRVFKQDLGKNTIVRFAPSGSMIAACGRAEPAIQIWKLDTGKASGTIPLPYTVESFAFSPDGKSLALTSRRPIEGGSKEGGWLAVWNAETHTNNWSIVADTRLVPSLAFSPNGRTLVTGNADHYVHLYDVNIGETRQRSASEHPGWVLSTSFSPQGELIASASTEVMLWNARTARCEATLQGHTGRSIAKFLDERTLASASEDGLIRLWDVPAALRWGEWKPGELSLYQKATSVDELTRAMENGDSKGLRMRRAHSFVVAHQYDDAVADVIRAVELGATIDFIDGTIWDVLESPQQVDSAIAALDELVAGQSQRIDPLEVRGRLCLNAGESLLRRGDWERSKPYFQKAAESYSILTEIHPPKAWWYLHERAHAHAVLRKYTWAYDDISRAIDFSDNDADTRCRRATYLQHLGRWAEAVDDYARVIELDDDGVRLDYRDLNHAAMAALDSPNATVQRIEHVLPVAREAVRLAKEHNARPNTLAAILTTLASAQLANGDRAAALKTQLEAVTATRSDLANFNEEAYENLARIFLADDAEPDVVAKKYLDLISNQTPKQPSVSARFLAIGAKEALMGPYKNAQVAEAWAQMSLRLFDDLENAAIGSMWQRNNAASILGQAISRQGRFTEAEPLVKDAAEWMLTNLGDPSMKSPASHEWTEQAVGRVIEMYRAWDESDPEAGYDIKADRWEKRLTIADSSSADK